MAKCLRIHIVRMQKPERNQGSRIRYKGRCEKRRDCGKRRDNTQSRDTIKASGFKYRVLMEMFCYHTSFYS